MCPTDIEAASNEIADLVRKEVQHLMHSGKNWKLVISGNVGGDVRTVVELHDEALRRFVPVIKASSK